MKPNTSAMPTVTINAACATLNRLIDLVTDSHEPILISGEHANAVLCRKQTVKQFRNRSFFFRCRACINLLKIGLSGLGREGGRSGIDEYLESKYVNLGELG